MNPRDFSRGENHEELHEALVDLKVSSVSMIYTLMIQAREGRENPMRRKLMVIASLIAIAVVVLAVAVSPILHPAQNSTPPTSIQTVPNDQCRIKADANAKYPLLLQIWNPAGDPVRQGWIVLYDPDRGIPFEEGYNNENGTYRTKHTYSPSQNMTLIIQSDQQQDFQNYVVDVVISDVVCADGCIHVEARAS
jgi:hypothetical protein